MSNASTADEQIRALMAGRTPAARLRMCARMFAGAKTLVRAGMAAEHRLGSPSTIRRQLFLRMYGADFSKAQREAILKGL